MSKNPIQGTQLKLNKPICKLWMQGLISRQDAKDLKEFKKMLANDGLKGGVFEVKIKKAAKLTGVKFRRGVSHKGIVSDKKSIMGHDVIHKGKGLLKECLEAGYTWYKTVSKSNFDKVLEEVKDEAIKNKKRTLLNFWKLKLN